MSSSGNTDEKSGRCDPVARARVALERVDGFIFHKCPRLEAFMWNHLHAPNGLYRISRRSHGLLFSVVAFALGVLVGLLCSRRS